MHLFAFLILFSLGVLQFVIFHHATPSPGAFRLAVALTVIVQFGLTAWRPARGLLLLLFLLPLFNNSIFVRRLNDFPPALALFLSFFAGWLLRRLDQGDTSRVKTPLNAPLILYTLAGLGSGTITLLRYADFYPFVGDRFPIFSVNPLNETSLEAVIWAFRILLVFLSGPGVFWATLHIVRRKNQIPHALAALACGLSLSIAFGLYQSHGHAFLGNWPFFERAGRINATFLDPNALGSFVLLSLPAVSALLFALRNRAAKVGILLVLAGGLCVLGYSGSRTGMLGLVLATLIAGGLALAQSAYAGIGIYSRYLRPVLLALVIVVAFAPSRMQSLGDSDSALARRLTSTIGKVRERGLVGMLGEDRWPMWQRALKVTAAFPVWGIGLGAFHTEVPNYVEHDFNRSFYRDNANSFYLQTTSEMGAIGLILALAVLTTVVQAALRGVRRPCYSGGDLAVSSLLAGALISMTVMFLTGPHTFFPEVQILFWALIGLVFANLYSIPPRADYSSPAGAEPRPFRRLRLLPAVGVALVAVLMVGQTIDAATTLSLGKQVNLHEWNATWGFYPWERGSSGERLRWTREEAGTVVVTPHSLVATRLFLPHADLNEDPVVVSILLNGQKAYEEAFDEPTRSRRVTLLLPRTHDGRIDIRFRVSRVWVPSRHDAGSLDSRELGVMVSDFQFHDIPPDGFGFSDWQGDGDKASNPYRTIRSRAAQQIDLSTGNECEFLASVEPSSDGSPPPILSVYADNRLVCETHLPEKGWRRVQFRVSPDPGQISSILRLEIQNPAGLPPGLPPRAVRVTQVRPISTRG
ncbi:O-antigen ligase family protein [Candidatus Sumerlaeota bacterium]|nr:O-antigen ligase family protein [Candidatus Sumerlaeota bacterium]